MIPALPEVEAYAARILDALFEQESADDHYTLGSLPHGEPLYADSRRRVERDVEGLEDIPPWAIGPDWLFHEREAHALRYWTDLCEVGALYGQPWEVQS